MLLVHHSTECQKDTSPSSKSISSTITGIGADRLPTAHIQQMTINTWLT